MKLHRFHISKLRDAGLKRDSSTYTLANDGVCGVFIYSAVATGSDQRAFETYAISSPVTKSRTIAP